MLRISSIALAGWAALSAPAGAVSPPPVAAPNGMVVTAHRLASEVGARILADGGNAVDAAVAVGYALAVVHPCCGNLGGGGFATLRLADGRTLFLDFRETAPGAATPTMYLDAKGELIKGLSLNGYQAVGVPGSVLGLDTLLARYGTLPRERIMAPAIALARDGYVLGEADAAILATGAKAFAAEPNVAAIFLHDGKPWAAGDRLVQTDLAATLDLIARDGPKAFYDGPIAAAVVEASDAHGGILSRADFAGYKVQETAPVECDYRGYGIISAPPPSSGGTIICETLGILEGFPLAETGYGSAASIHLLVEALRHAFVDRNFELGDPAFVDNPVERLVSDTYTAAIRAAIDREKATKSADLKPGVAPHEGTETTHYSVVDKDGNAVAVTTTINGYFGAKVIAGNTGFFLNNEMDDFTTRPGAPNLFGLVQGSANVIAPGKRPLSSMSPTIVTRDGKSFLVLGSPGGPRIISATVETILNVVDYGMDIKEAVNAPRVHHQWLPDKIFIEKRALSPDTVERLKAMGHEVEEQTYWGATAAIMIGPPPAAPSASNVPDSMVVAPEAAGVLYGASDDRQPAGAAIGH